MYGCLLYVQRQHAELVGSDMDDDGLTDEQRQDLQKIRHRKKQVCRQGKALAKNMKDSVSSWCAHCYWGRTWL